MKVNPQCPTCKTNRRAIASHKVAIHTPGRFDNLLTKFKLGMFVRKPRYVYKCNICNQEFRGIQKKGR